MKKILITSLISLMLATNVSADTDGENNLSKKNSGEVKDCFENVNRVTFKFNHPLNIVLKLLICLPTQPNSRLCLCP